MTWVMLLHYALPLEKTFDVYCFVDGCVVDEVLR